MKRIRFQFCTLFMVLLYAGALAFGQTDRATITGTVSDPTGAAIGAAHVLATNTDTGTSYSGTTNNNGIYTIPGLPVGTYALKVNQPGFKDFAQTGIILIAAQVLQLNVHLTVGSSAETVTISGGVPLLETESTTVSMTMEESALRDLPLDATNGRDALSLVLASTPLANASLGGQTDFGTQNLVTFAGEATYGNSVYVDGLESSAGMQGQIATPGLDALSEVQLITSPSDAEFGTGGGVEMLQIKSGTNKFHGSAFEFLQNEDLNANAWANNYFLAQCAPGDSSCRAANSRALDRFNDYGASGGGPIWKNHTFIFGDFELYDFSNDVLNPNSGTVPTPQMLTGDFSQLLTGGVNQGIIPGPNGSLWINPCTGEPYMYGQIFDPATQQVVNGATCATPFAGNIIPSGRLSPVSNQVAALYSKYPPTLSSRIYDNFSTLANGAPLTKKFTLDLKLDHTFSTRHHLSAGLNHVSWRELLAANSGLNTVIAGPLSNDVYAWFPNVTYRIIDNYEVRPNLLNTFGIGFAEDHSLFYPQNPVNPANYGITGPPSPYFPRIVYDGQSSNVGNGIQESDLGSNLLGDYDSNSYQYQDTVQWSKGRHAIKFGGTLKAQELNSQWGSNLQTINIYGDTGGPTDPGLTPYVGFAFANQMLGDVQSTSVAVAAAAYPRQKELALFFQDDYKATPRLTLNLGMRWDMTTRDHEKFGHLQNFDLTASNPNWAPYTGAWAFSKGPGTTFETNQDYHEFGPHLGGAYRLTDKLVARASYGLFYAPDGLLNAVFGGTGSGYISVQTELAYPVNQVINNIPGSIGYNWTNGYPGQAVLSPQNSAATSIPAGDIAMYTHPDFLHPGFTENWYVGTEYQLTKGIALDLSYVANRGLNLHDPARSLYRNSPNINAYMPLLQSGNVNSTISNSSQAAAAGVPYPYPGFTGPAYAAIAPFPQIAASAATMQAVGDPADAAVSSFNSFFIEVKARQYHGLYLDFSDTFSKVTGSQLGSDGWGNDWSNNAQNLTDWEDSEHWVQSYDQRNLAKGYATYLLPVGRGQQWVSGSSTLLNTFVGGWELGYYGSYGSGMPLGRVESPYQVPYFFNTPSSGSDRAFFAPGLNAHDIQNHFSGHLDLANLNDPSNNDFTTNIFQAGSVAAPFGNTPYTFNHWRWNPGVAHENMSLLKHFDTGERAKMIVGVQFFDIFNRHYYGSPNTNMSSTTFGQVTSVSGYRYGQLSARIQW
jgi:hypothetical protein